MTKRAEPVLNLNFLNNYVLEDEIYLRLDKLQALCATQALIDNSDIPNQRHISRHYAMVMEEQLGELRKLLNQLFN